MKIAVCGAGIGGLSAAILLSRAGHSVTVFDRYDQPAPVGSGLMLQRTGLAVLDQLGLKQQIHDCGARIDRLFGRSVPSGRAVLDVRFSAWSPSLHALGVQRGLVFNVLIETATQAGAHIVPETEITSVDPETGEISALNARTIGGFDLVIDALGQKSPLSGDLAIPLPYGALWATLDWPENGPFDPHALEQRYRSAQQMSGVMPSGSLAKDGSPTLTYFWSIRGDAVDRWRSQPLDTWKSEAIALWPETEQLVDRISDHNQLVFASYRHRTRKMPVSGRRLVHIGDSWHATSPQLGQGANTALLDAWALCQSLEKHNEIADALSAYTAARQGHVRLYQLLSWALTPVYQGDGKWVPALRDWLAAPVLGVWPIAPLLAALVSGAFGRPLRRLQLRDEC